MTATKRWATPSFRSGPSFALADGSIESKSILMSATPDDLSSLKDDMIAFTEGHGLRRFQGYVDYDEVQGVMWDTSTNSEGWKDFVELAKAAGVAFVTMHSLGLERGDLDDLAERLKQSEFADGDDLEDARWMAAFVGKLGFVQMGFAYEGTMFLCEVATEWYEQYQRLLELSDDFGGIPMDGMGQDEES